jgi:hypothetical protein
MRETSDGLYIKYPDERRKLLCWMIRHNSHGLSLDTAVWLPAGDKPETNADWVRAPWLDQPAHCTLAGLESDALEGLKP